MLCLSFFKERNKSVPAYGIIRIIRRFGSMCGAVLAAKRRGRQASGEWC